METQPPVATPAEATATPVGPSAAPASIHLNAAQATPTQNATTVKRKVTLQQIASCPREEERRAHTNIAPEKKGKTLIVNVLTLPVQTVQVLFVLPHLLDFQAGAHLPLKGTATLGGLQALVETRHKEIDSSAALNENAELIRHPMTLAAIVLHTVNGPRRETVGEDGRGHTPSRKTATPNKTSVEGYSLWLSFERSNTTIYILVYKFPDVI